jgi:succinate dehydrogenase / fumarate reductase flavoprotein subunit
MRRTAKDLASRDVVSRCMTMEIREGRGVGKNKDHIFLHLDHLDPDVLAERLPGISESAKIFAGVDVTASRSRCCRPCTTTWAASRPTTGARCSTRRQGPGRDPAGPDGRRRGRLRLRAWRQPVGSNSLIDLVVFGRAAAIRPAKWSTGSPPCRHSTRPACEKIMDHFDRVRHAMAATPTAELRDKMQKAMQEDAAVFRTQETLEQGCRGFPRSGRSCPTSRSPTAR